jgi:hypothetical protein
MRPLHDSIAKLLAEQIKARRVVVWYDERAEFQPFVNKLVRPSLVGADGVREARPRGSRSTGSSRRIVCCTRTRSAEIRKRRR